MSLNTVLRAAAAVIAAVLLVGLASAGSATAARLITGKNIKNNSITGKDIRNGSIGAVDLSPSATQALTGPAGPAGPPVLTDVYSASLFVSPALAEDDSAVVLEKTLPAGKSYLLSAKLTLFTVGVGQHHCDLRSGPLLLDTATVTTTAANSKNPLMMTGATGTSGPARVSCTVDGGVGAAQQVKLIAIPVASIG